ncbi:MAG: GYD domain-containing protein [Armatimonadetes bacterium]|nr:GYD domain-containing protein [Armatimonadota bacterium]
MPTYILLGKFTDQGVRHIKASPDRAGEFREAAAKVGVEVKAIYWTLGQFDVIAIVTAPDEDACGTLIMDLAARGNVRTQTMRAFDQEEMRRILGGSP